MAIKKLCNITQKWGKVSMQIPGGIECVSIISEHKRSCWFRHRDGIITSNPFFLSTQDRTIAFTLQFYILRVSRIPSKFPTVKTYNRNWEL